MWQYCVLTDHLSVCCIHVCFTVFLQEWHITNPSYEEAILNLFSLHRSSVHSTVHSPQPDSHQMSQWLWLSFHFWWWFQFYRNKLHWHNLKYNRSPQLRSNLAPIYILIPYLFSCHILEDLTFICQVQTPIVLCHDWRSLCWACPFEVLVCSSSQNKLCKYSFELTRSKLIPNFYKRICLFGYWGLLPLG